MDDDSQRVEDGWKLLLIGAEAQIEPVTRRKDHTALGPVFTRVSTAPMVGRLMEWF